VSLSRRAQFPQGMGNKQIVTSGHERKEWCDHIWKFLEHTN
jgi:hypothetical protein